MSVAQDEGEGGGGGGGVMRGRDSRVDVGGEGGGGGVAVCRLRVRRQAAWRVVGGGVYEHLTRVMGEEWNGDGGRDEKGPAVLCI
jgi:hypothetical protein